MSKFLFINLTSTDDDSYTIGPLTLLTSLKSAGYDCDFYDNIIHSNTRLGSALYFEDNLDKDLELHELPANIQHIFSEIAKVITPETKMIGFCVLFSNFHAAMFFSKALKALFPNVLNIFGGPLFFFPEHFGLNNMEKRPYIDSYVKGKAEDTVQEIFKADFDFTNLKNLKGLCFRESNTDSWHIDATINQFTEFTPISYENSANVGYVNTSFSVGCPYKCTFCTQDDYYKDYILAPVEKCMEILTPLKNKFVYVTDALINANHIWLKNLCQKMIDDELNIKWGSWFRVAGQLKNKDYLELLYDSGCRKVNFGFESASGPVLKHMMKYSNEQGIYQIFNNIRQLIKEGKPMQVGINVLIGYPNETEEDFLKTCKFILFNQDIINFVNSCNLVSIAPHGRLHKILQKNNEINLIDGENWATAQSNPAIRFKRLEHLQALLKKIKLESSSYHTAEKLRNSPPETWATFPAPNLISNDSLDTQSQIAI
jgi:radical SAM superfamily enzyme YgiQ (UPF0313 family)